MPLARPPITGLHGANRMASNSLLECLVFGRARDEHIAARAGRVGLACAARPWDESRVSDSDEEVVISHNWDELRLVSCGTTSGSSAATNAWRAARRRIDLLKPKSTSTTAISGSGNDLLELRNLLDIADLIVQSAQRRRESRGLHYNIDFPDRDPNQAVPTVLIPITMCHAARRTEPTAIRSGHGAVASEPIRAVHHQGQTDHSMLPPPTLKPGAHQAGPDDSRQDAGDFDQDAISRHPDRHFRNCSALLKVTIPENEI